jgi:hypothetical protein
MHSRLIAWIALFATLFSAASPTLAAALLSHEPAALARMLGLPPAAAADADAAKHAHHAHQTHEEAHHETAPQQNTDGGNTHPAHGIYCSLCLNPSSIATIAPAPVSIAVLNLEYHVSPPALPAARDAAFHPLYRSRAPPRVS